MSDQTTEEAVAEIWRLFKETDARFKETDARLAQQSQETDRKLRQLEGLFTSQWGKMLEALVQPGALRLFSERGLNVHRAFPRALSRLDGESMEIDLLLENETDVVVVEVKSTLKVADVQEFLDALEQFPRFFPRYRDTNIYGAVAGLTIDENADRYAYRQGLFVLGMSGEDMVHILNDDQFRPANFNPTA